MARTARARFPAPENIFGLGRAGLTPPLRAAVARGETSLLAYSDELLPRSREWPGMSKRPGWWTLPTACWTPPPELAASLPEREPIYVGFGSMTFKDRDETFRAVLGVLDKTGARAIVTAGWGDCNARIFPLLVFALDEHRTIGPSRSRRRDRPSWWRGHNRRGGSGRKAFNRHAVPCRPVRLGAHALRSRHSPRTPAASQTDRRRACRGDHDSARRRGHAPARGEIGERVRAEDRAAAAIHVIQRGSKRT